MKKEIELKYRLLSKLDLELFLNFVQPLKIGNTTRVRQENSYFDDQNLRLKKNGISLRLRQQNDDYFLCAKQSLKDKKQKHNLSVRLEYEMAISKDVALLVKEHYVSPLEAFLHLPAATEQDELTKKTLYRHMNKVAKTGLYMIGSFVNHRIIVPISLLGQTIYLELDHSTYPQSIEIFEIEVEFSSVKDVLALRPALEELFHKAQVKTYHSSSKSSRLYKIMFG
jgi:uncharacterized protein YjbK